MHQLVLPSLHLIQARVIKHHLFTILTAHALTQLWLILVICAVVLLHHTEQYPEWTSAVLCITECVI